MIPFRHTIIILMTLIWGCQIDSARQPIEKDGRLYGVTQGLFRDRWWNYYERGTSFADGEFWEQAESDFREAIKRKDLDRYRIKTYGWHLVEYFPHRELGVVLYKQKRWTESIAELETSLSFEKSARAEYYLDQSRKLFIEVNQMDRANPDIFIHVPEQNRITNQAQITVHGAASDDTFVQSVQLNGQTVRMDVSQSRIEFQERIKLSPGKNTLNAEAVDLTGKIGRMTLSLYCDRSGPVVNVRESVRSDHPGEWLIKGYAHDDSGIKEIEIGGQIFKLSGSREVLLNHRVMLPDQLKTVRLAVTDLAGNTTAAEISLMHFTEPRSAFCNRSLTAGLDSDTAADVWRGIVPPAVQQKQDQELIGNFRALIIGIDEYDGFPALKTPVSDAAALKAVLIRRYGFEDHQIRFRINGQASWKTLIDDLKQITAEAERNDNVLVYFGGHGELDPLTGDGYWIPSDGKSDDPSTWITHSAISNLICSENSRAKNIIIISDSCYSGAMLNVIPDASAFSKRPVPKQSPLSLNSGVSRSGKSIGANELTYTQKLLSLTQKKSRQVISSGGSEPVSDKMGEKGTHSLFAHYLLEALSRNDQDVIAVEDLIASDVWNPLTMRGQRPRIGRFVCPYDEDGQFVLALKPGAAGGQKRESSSPDLNISHPSSDNPPPFITVQGWNTDSPVFIDQALIELTVEDETGIQSVSINHHKLLKRPGASKLHLNYLAELKPENNTFIIECTDQLGSRSVKEIHIRRQTLKIYDMGARMSVMIFPLETKGSLFPDDLLLKYLMETQRFNLLKPDDLTDSIQIEPSDHARKIAEKFHADFMLTGKASAKKGYLDIRLQLTETRSSQVVTVPDVYGEYTDEDEIKELCRALAVKLWDDLPLIEGQIVKIDRQKVIANLGTDHRIRAGMHLIFFREGEPVRDMGTGKLLGSDTEELGGGRFQSILPKMSHIALFEHDTVARLAQGTRFITK